MDVLVTGVSSVLSAKCLCFPLSCVGVSCARWCVLPVCRFPLPISSPYCFVSRSLHMLAFSPLYCCVLSLCPVKTSARVCVVSSVLVHPSYTYLSVFCRCVCFSIPSQREREGMFSAPIKWSIPYCFTLPAAVLSHAHAICVHQSRSSTFSPCPAPLAIMCGTYIYIHAVLQLPSHRCVCVTLRWRVNGSGYALEAYEME